MHDRLIAFKMGDIYQLLGRFGLPPWEDENGNVIGANVDCSKLASEMAQALKEIEIEIDVSLPKTWEELYG